VTLTAAITSSPAGAQYLPTLSFGSAATVSITGASAATATLYVTTTQATVGTALVNPVHHGPFWQRTGAVLACLLLFGIPARRRARWSIFAMLGFFLILTGGIVACGGGGGGGGSTGTPSTPGTTTGTYTVTVTCTSGTTALSTGTLTVIVQ
jgi:hypothetical protein